MKVVAVYPDDGRWRQVTGLLEWCCHHVLDHNSTDDTVHLAANGTMERMKALKPFDLVLLCGTISCYMPATVNARLIEIPCPTDKRWGNRSLAYLKRLVQEGSSDVSIEFGWDNKLIVKPLCPF